MASAEASLDTREKILATGQRIIAGKGYAAVGLSEILASAGVPKGSFYHYFVSKDAFGEALLTAYFDDYLADIDATLGQVGLTCAERLMNYWAGWRQTQSVSDCEGKCLAVKLGAEVADLSEPMRLALKHGTARIVARLAAAIEGGVAEGSLAVEGDPAGVAHGLYQLWLGASVMAKIHRTSQPFETSMALTRRVLHIAGPAGAAATPA